MDPLDVEPGKSLAEQSDDGQLIGVRDAARLLLVSRAVMESLLCAGKLGEITETEGGRRYVLRSAVVAYRERRKEGRLRALQDLTELSQRMGLYDDDLWVPPTL